MLASWSYGSLPLCSIPFSTAALIWDTPIVEDLENDGKVTSEAVEMSTVYKVSSKDLRSDDVLNTEDRKNKLKKMLDAARGTISQEELQKIVDCTVQAQDVFSLQKSERGEVMDIQHVIDTGDSPPARQGLCRIPFALRAEVTKIVEEMLATGVIEESNSPWASPMVLVHKPDGSLRFCVDYRKLNAATRKDAFPLPHIDDLFDQLSGRKIFSTLDACTGYWQIQVQSSSRDKTAFITIDGLFKFRVIPFGLCNAPATFMWVMQKALAGLNEILQVS